VRGGATSPAPRGGKTRPARQPKARPVGWYGASLFLQSSLPYECWSFRQTQLCSLINKLQYFNKRELQAYKLRLQAHKLRLQASKLRLHYAKGKY
jgi:hypothetical protein